MVTDAYKSHPDRDPPAPRLPWDVICWLIGGFFVCAVGIGAAYSQISATLATHGTEIVGLRRDIDYDRADRQQFQAEMRGALGIRAGK